MESLDDLITEQKNGIVIRLPVDGILLNHSQMTLSSAKEMIHLQTIPIFKLQRSKIEVNFEHQMF